MFKIAACIAVAAIMYCTGSVINTFKAISELEKNIEQGEIMDIYN